MERRQFIAGSAIAALSVSALPMAAATSTVDRAEWEHALADYFAADKACSAYDAEYFRVYDRWKDSQPSIETIHWQQFWPMGHHTDGQRQVAMLEDLDVRWARCLDGQGKWWFPGPDGPEPFLAKERAAIDSVQAYRDAVEHHERESGMKAAEDRMESLTDALCNAGDKLMQMPAPDLAALRWKLDHLTDAGRRWSSWSDEYVAGTLADIARLLPKAG